MSSLASWVNSNTIHPPLLLQSTGQVLAPTLSHPRPALPERRLHSEYLHSRHPVVSASPRIDPIPLYSRSGSSAPFYRLAVILAYPPRDLPGSICAGASSQPFPLHAPGPGTSLQGLSCDSNTNGRSIYNLHLLRAARPTPNCLYLSTCQCQAPRYLCANLFRHCSDQLHFPHALPHVVTLLTNLLRIINPLGHLLSTPQPSSG